MRTLFLLTVLLPGCGSDTCKVTDPVTPGCGVEVDGSALRIGDPMAEVEDALGKPDEVRDLGELGTRFVYRKHKLSGLLDLSGAVASLHLRPGFWGKTADGVGIGTGEDRVRLVFGEPQVDPFEGAWWYGDQGLTVQWRDGEVTALEVYGPDLTHR